MGREEVPIVRPMSWAGIELIATQLLRGYYPECLKEPQPTPIEDFLEFVLPEEFDVDVRYGILPPSTEAVMKPITDRNRPEVLMSPDTYVSLLARNGRARYTAAHESFHGIHHAKELRSALYHGTHSGLFRRTQIPPYRNPERQADVFAARFLMPGNMVRRVFRESGGDFSAVVDTFLVSNQAAVIRLEELELLPPRLR